MAHIFARNMIRALIIAAMGACSLLIPQAANALIPCAIYAIPTTSPAHPSSADLISVYGLGWVYVLPTILPIGTSIVSRTTTPADHQYAIDIVLTAHPENFPGYSTIALPF